MSLVNRLLPQRCMIMMQSRNVMYKVSSSISPPVRPLDKTYNHQDKLLHRQLDQLEQCCNTLDTRSITNELNSGGSHQIHVRRLIYLLESNAQKLRQMNST